MSIDVASLDRALLAQHRFGYGPTADALTEIARDPLAHVVGQLAAPALADPAAMGDSASVLRQFRTVQYNQRVARGQGPEQAKTASKAMRDAVNGCFRQEIALAVGRAVTSSTPFVERLVAFWSNHFCVSCLKGPGVRMLAGVYEREAIRPHVTGKFRDMLGAVVHHPAMLLYLDNLTSIGPNSPAAKKAAYRKKTLGLNENLGRELLELHTVGVRAGYSQADVTNAARILTGWGLTPASITEGPIFAFDESRHEPGAFTVMGKTYPALGKAQGEALLDDLARHPATADHIATKLSRSFVGDQAPAALIAAVAETFIKTDGDLKATATTLVTHPASWSGPAGKVISPLHFIVVLQRLTGHRLSAGEIVGIARALGQDPWAPPAPKGFADEDRTWLAPDSMVKRFDIALRIAGRVSERIDAESLAENLFGDRLSPDLAVAIGRAATRSEALATLIMSPDIQMR